MEQLDKTGIKAMVGKVNMDRNGSPQLQEESAQASADATVQWIKDTLDKFENVKILCGENNDGEEEYYGTKLLNSIPKNVIKESLKYFCEGKINE